MSTIAIVFIFITSVDGLRLLNRNDHNSYGPEPPQSNTQLLKKLECNGNTVLLIDMNKDFIDNGMFYNWYHYAQPFLKASNVQLLIKISDKESHELLRIKELSNNSAIMTETNNIFTMKDLRAPREKRFYQKISDGSDGGFLLKTNEEIPYGARAFRNMMAERVGAIKALLSAGCTVLHADIDTAWLANPFDDINEAGAQKAIFTSDEGNEGIRNALMQNKSWWFGSGVRAGICGCFMYMPPSLLSAKCDFFGRWTAATQKYGNDEQFGLNDALQKCMGDIDFDLLPSKHYSPGGMNAHTAHIIHANYVRGHTAKIWLLQMKSVWHPSTVEWLKAQKKK